MEKSFTETDEKWLVRSSLRKAAELLGRSDLTYLGMPEADAFDIRVLKGLVKNVICIDWESAKLDVAQHNISDLPLTQQIFHNVDVWDYLKGTYYAEPLCADVTFLDFLGGGLSKQGAFSHEIHALRSYFSKHAAHPNTAFVFAWTYMPHDAGPAAYIDAIEKFAKQLHVDSLKRLTGVLLRSQAVRLILYQLLLEHGMTAKIYSHIIYKKVMSTLVMVFSKGHDPRCGIKLGLPESILTDPIRDYSKGQAIPGTIHLPSLANQ